MRQSIQKSHPDLKNAKMLNRESIDSREESRKEEEKKFPDSENENLNYIEKRAGC
jgi:hypothetical protein